MRGTKWHHMHDMTWHGMAWHGITPDFHRSAPDVIVIQSRCHLVHLSYLVLPCLTLTYKYLVVSGLVPSCLS